MSTFFKSLEAIADKVELQINIKAKDGTITVMVLPKAAIKDAAAGTIKPIIMTGTAEELDNEFAQAVWQPLSKTAGIVHNIAEFESASEKLNKENAAAKAKEEEEKKQAEARKKKFDDLIAKAKTARDKRDFNQALHIYNEALPLTDKPAEVNKLIEETKRAAQGSLFAAMATTPEELVAVSDPTIEEPQTQVSEDNE